MNEVNKTSDEMEDIQRTETDPKDEPLTIKEIIFFLGGSTIVAVIAVAVFSYIPTNLILGVTQSAEFILVFLICFGYGFIMLVIGFSVRLLFEILLSMAG